MAHRIEGSPHGENFVRYSAQAQHDSAVSYSALPDRATSTILSFLQESNFSGVAREWRDENRPLLNRTIQEITFRDQPMQERMAEVRERVGGQDLANLVTTAFQEASGRWAQLVLARRLSAELVLQHAAVVMNYFVIHKNPQDDTPRLRFLDFLRSYGAAMDNLGQAPENPEALRAANARIVDTTMNFFARENLALRFQRVLDDQGLNPDENPEQYMRLLHQRELEYARALGGADEHAFYPHPSSDDSSYFLGVEEALLRQRLQDPAQKLALQRMWYGSQVDFAVNPPELSAERIRLNLFDPERDFSNIEYIRQENHPVIPPEISKLTGLEKLGWEGPLRGLPEEMEELENLSRLFFRNTNFSELPSVLERIPALSLLSIQGNQQPIRRISERLWNNLMGTGLEQTLVSWLFAEKVRVIYNIPLEQIRELPLEMWFLNNYTVPYIPHSFATVGGDYQGLDFFWRASLACVFAVINSPILLINLIIVMTTRLLFNTICDDLGYDRMINLDE